MISATDFKASLDTVTACCSILKIYLTHLSCIGWCKVAWERLTNSRLNSHSFAWFSAKMICVGWTRLPMKSSSFWMYDFIAIIQSHSGKHRVISPELICSHLLCIYEVKVLGHLQLHSNVWIHSRTYDHWLGWIFSIHGMITSHSAVIFCFTSGM